MKKTFFSRLGMFALMATVALAAAAADFGGKKYYINPGHGGHDSDDRPTALPLSVAMFYESDGTLSRGLFLRDFIKANGGAVKMSRTTNTTADDLPLSTIASQSNSYGGYFISLHTNGANASANYIVAFYKSSSSSSTNVVSGSSSMTKKAVDWHNNNHLTNLTYTTQRSMGDYQFYGYNLGVLRTNNRPGYLVETIFHDYRPDGLRLKSDIYNKYTAWQLLMACKENSGGSAGASGNVKGCIIGDIRDQAKTCGYTNYTTRGRDGYFAVNGAKVVLKNSAGTTVASMTTDKCANGLYGFFDLTAGTYTITVSKSGYKTQTKTVTVANNASTKQLFNLVQGSDNGLAIEPYTGFTSVFAPVTLKLDGTPPETYEAIKLKVTATGVTDPITITSSSAKFVLNKTELANTGGTFTVTYKPKVAGDHKTTVTVTSGSYSAKLVLNGSAVMEKLKFGTGWKFGQVPGKDPDWLPSGNWNKLRNMCYGDGKLYIVDPSDCRILVINAQTGAYIRDLDMTGISKEKSDDNGHYGVMDVKYVDGKVVACNITTATTEYLNVYVWDTDQDAPRRILHTKTRSSYPRLGDTFDVNGNLTDGKLVFISNSFTDKAYSSIFFYPITNGVVSTTPTAKKLTLDDGTNIVLGSSPRAIASADGKQYWVMGQNYAPTLVGEDGKAVTAMNTAAINNVIQGNDMETFSLKGTDYAMATTYAQKGATVNNETVTETLTHGTTALIDVTNGIADGTMLRLVPVAGLGTTRNDYFSTSVEVNTDSENYVEAWVLISKQGIGYYTWGNIPAHTIDSPKLTSPDGANHNFGEVMIGDKATKTFTINGTNLTGDITVSTTVDEMKVEPETISATALPATVTLTYEPATAESVSGSIKFTSPGASTLSYTVKGTGVEPVMYELEQPEEVWNVSTNRDNVVNSGWNATEKGHLRSLAVKDNELYVLSVQLNPDIHQIHVVNATTGGSMGRSLDLQNVSGGIWPVSHIAMLGKTLYASNCAGTGEELKVYRWNDSRSPSETVLSYAVPEGFARMGEIMGTWGDEQDGRLMFFNDNTLTVFHVTEGIVNTTPVVINVATGLGGYNSCNDVIYNGDGTYTITTKDSMPTRVDSTGKIVESLPAAALTNKYGSHAAVFTYGTRSYMAATAYKGSSASTALGNGVLNVADITGGLQNASLKYTLPADGLGAKGNSQFVSDLEAQVTDNGATLNLWVLIPYQGVAMYRYQAEPEEKPTVDRAHHAYDLNTELAEELDRTTFNYTLTGDVKNVRLHLKKRPAATAVPGMRRTATAITNPDYTFEQGEKAAGTHSFTVNHYLLDPALYDWSVEVENYPVEAGQKVFHYSPEKTANASGRPVRGGVAVVTDPESPAYGKIVTSNGLAQGYMIFSPDHVYEGTYCTNHSTWDANNASSTYRMGKRDDGKLYAADWSDAGAGVYVFDPANPDEGTHNIFTGSQASSGLWTYNGTATGGGTSCVAFTGTGADTRMWVFDEDGSPVNTVKYFNIGSAEYVTSAPVVPNSSLSGSGLLANTNVEIVADQDHGLFIAQSRTNTNNTTSCPGFVYTDLEGNILYNSGSQADIIPGCGGGLALSEDRKTLAVSGGQQPIRIYDVTWNANGAPTLSLREVLAESAGDQTVTPQMAFDNAGNLAVYQSSTDESIAGLNVYSLAHKGMVASTPASFVQVADATVTSIDDICIDRPDANAVYYDLRGVRMPAASALIPGVYLKVTGGKAVKVRIL